MIVQACSQQASCIRADSDGPCSKYTPDSNRVDLVGSREPDVTACLVGNVEAIGIRWQRRLAIRLDLSMLIDTTENQLQQRAGKDLRHFIRNKNFLIYLV